VANAKNATHIMQMPQWNILYFVALVAPTLNDDNKLNEPLNWPKISPKMGSSADSDRDRERQGERDREREIDKRVGNN